ncbi:hypothetical protein [Rhizobium binae]|uniref:hypothetical protein n=1 Tax=Rhizobium binae TaxID=1138190 RepID=UPI001C83CEBC|nr:hypothetical protein [Rhizobium binae]MBX4962916.1 hypothetical protein [Rhizobium binae]
MPFGTATCAAVLDFLLPVTFFWPFFWLALVRPALRRFSGRDRCGHQGESPADLMAATDFESRPAFFKAGKSIFRSMILFGEDVRLHYL